MPVKANKIVTLDEAVDSFETKQAPKRPEQKPVTLDQAVTSFQKKKEDKSSGEKSSAGLPFDFKSQQDKGGLALGSRILRGKMNYANKKITPEDINVLQTHDPLFAGQTGLTNADTDEKKQAFSDFHNQPAKSDLDESIRNIVSKYPFASTPEGQASAKKVIDAFNTGNTQELFAYKDAIVSNLEKQIPKEVSAGGVSGAYGVSRPLTDEQVTKSKELKDEINKVNQTFTDYIDNVAAGKKVGNGEELLDVEVRRLGEQREKMLLGNNSFKQRELLTSNENKSYQQSLEKTKASNLPDYIKQAASQKLAENHFSTENINYEREKTGLEMILNNLTMEYNDLAKKSLTTNPELQDQTEAKYSQLKYYRDMYNGLDDKPEYADVRVTKTARFIGDEFVKRHGDLKIASAHDIRKTALEVDKDNPGFLAKYGTDIDYLERHTNMIPMAGFKGGAKTGLYEIGKNLGTGFGYFGGTDIEKASRDVSDEYKSNIKGTGWTEPTRVVFNKEDKAYRELPNEDYGKLNWNNTFRFLGQSAPGLAEFVLLDKGLGKAAKLVSELGVSGLLTISKNAAALKGIDISVEELTAARRALSIGQGTQRSLGLFGALTLSGHEQNRKIADDLIDDNSTTGEAKKTLLANLLNLSSFAAFKAAGITPSAVIEKTLQKGIAADAMEMFEKEGWKLTEKQAYTFFNNSVLPKLKAIGSTLGKNVIEGTKLGGAMVLDANTRGLISSIANPNKASVPSLKDDADLLVNQVILMTAAGLPGLVNAGFTPTNKDALYEAGLKFQQQFFRISQMKESGEITPQRANEMIAMSRTMAEEVAKVQHQTNDEGLPLTVKQKRDIAVNNFRKRAAAELKEKGHDVNAEKIATEADGEIKEIKKDNRFEEVKIDDVGNVTELTPEEKKASEVAKTEAAKQQVDFTGKDNNFLANREPDFFSPQEREQYNELMKKPETEDQAAQMVNDRKEEIKTLSVEPKKIEQPIENKPTKESVEEKVEVQKSAAPPAPVEVKPGKELSFEGVKRADAKMVYKRIREMDEPTDAAGLAYNYIAGGGKVNADDIVKEVTGTTKHTTLNTGAKEKKTTEVKDRDYADKDAPTIKIIAESLWHDLPEHLQDKISDQDIRNALIDVIGSHNKRLDAANAYVDKYNIEANLTEPERQVFERELPSEEKSLSNWIAEESDRTYENEQHLPDEELINHIIDNYDKGTETTDQQPSPEKEGTSSEATGEERRIEQDQAAEKTESEILRDSAARLREEGDEEGANTLETRATELEKQPPPPPSTPPPISNVSPESDEWTAIRKAEITDAIKLAQRGFDTGGVVTREESVKNGLTRLAAEAAPNKTLYEAASDKVATWADRIINEIRTLGKSLFNPNDEELAQMLYHRTVTQEKMSQLFDKINSDSDTQRRLAIAEFQGLRDELVKVDYVLNETGRVGGRAFGFKQYEGKLDPEYGLQIRRMELASAKEAKLTDEELSWVFDQWQKEQDLNQREFELKQQGMQDQFNKEMDQLGKDYDDKLKQAGSGRPDTQRTKTLSQKGKDIADKIRKLKRPPGAAIDFTFGTWDLAVEGIAKLVEAGASIAEAIDIMIKDNRVGFKADRDKKEFEDTLVRVLTRDDVLDSIKENAQLNKVSGITADMVSKNMIRDYVDSHIGEHEPKDILDKTLEGLKQVLPGVTKEELIKAYLKEDEFSQPNKKQLQTEFYKAKKELEGISKLEEDITDLENLRELRNRSFKSEREKSDAEKELLARKDELIKDKREKQKEIREQEKEPEAKQKKLENLDDDIRSLEQSGELLKKSKTKPTRELDQDIEDNKKKLKKVMTDMGVKYSSEDKFAKASYDSRAKSHNDRVDKVTEKLRDKINSGNLSEDQLSRLNKVNNVLDQAKISINPDSALSQKQVVDAAPAILRQIKSEFEKGMKMDDRLKLSDVSKSLQRLIDKFESDKQDSEQNVKLQRAKERLKNDNTERQRKLNAGEFEEEISRPLKKTDAELIKIQRQRNQIESEYRKKTKEIEDKNKPFLQRTFGLVRSAYVMGLIYKFGTLAKVTATSLLRPNIEALTKSTFGNIFKTLFPHIAYSAKGGGESSSWRSIAGSYGAYFKQMGEKRMNEIYDKANAKYESSAREYNEFKKNNPGKENHKLKDKMYSDMIDAQANLLYKYIGGSSIVDAWDAFVYRSNAIEREFGYSDVETYGTKVKGVPSLVKSLGKAKSWEYLLNSIGRSHSAIKTFSGRASFASGFIARLEAAVADGVDITKPDRILEAANESYLDWERGKYQQSNFVTDIWNNITRHVEKYDEGGEWSKYSKATSELLKFDVAITRVPVNILHEAVAEYTVGAFTSLWKVGQEIRKAKKEVLMNDNLMPGTDEFKQAVKDQLKNMDKKQAATIARSFRKGGFGLGLFAFTVLSSMINFGGFHHKGEKKKKESELGEEEVNPGEIMFGDNRVGKLVSGILDHQPAAFSSLLALNTAKVYQDQVERGETNWGAALDAAMSDLEAIQDAIPQTKVINPIQITKDIIKGSLRQADAFWEFTDVDENGDLVTRKPMNMTDELNLAIGRRDKVLTEENYKQALSIKRTYTTAIKNAHKTNASKEEIDALISERDNLIDKLYEEQ